MSVSLISATSMHCVLTLLVATFVLAPLDMKAVGTTAQVSVVVSENHRVINPYYYIIIIVDVDECATDYHDCDEHAQCMDTDGSFTCDCLQGYMGSGRVGNCTSKFD